MKGDSGPPDERVSGQRPRIGQRQLPRKRAYGSTSDKQRDPVRRSQSSDPERSQAQAVPCGKQTQSETDGQNPIHCAPKSLTLGKPETEREGFRGKGYELLVSGPDSAVCGKVEGQLRTEVVPPTTRNSGTSGKETGRQNWQKPALSGPSLACSPSVEPSTERPGDPSRLRGAPPVRCRSRRPRPTAPRPNGGQLRARWLGRGLASVFKGQRARALPRWTAGVHAIALPAADDQRKHCELGTARPGCLGFGAV